MDEYCMPSPRFTNASFLLLIENQCAPPLHQEHNDILLSADGPLWCVVTQLIIGLPFGIADKYMRCDSLSDPRRSRGPPYHPNRNLVREAGESHCGCDFTKANLIDPLLSALASSPGLADKRSQSKRLKPSPEGDVLPNLLANSRPSL